MNQMAMPRVRGARLRRFFPSSCAAAILLFTSGLFAQHAGDGVVTGVVSNKATGDLLAGATVMVDGSNVSTNSERGGDFTLQLPSGPHTLVVSYAGLDPARAQVNVEAGRTSTLNIALTSNVYVLDPV